MREQVRWLVVAVIVSVFLVAACVQSPVRPAGAVPATVERVVDGDTVDVVVGGETERVRVKGVDCPESVHPDESRNTEEGRAASEFTKSLLPPGTTVWLEADPAGDDSDGYGRILRYVWLVDPSGIDAADDSVIESDTLEGRLLSTRNAVTYVYAGERFKYRVAFEGIERRAEREASS